MWRDKRFSGLRKQSKYKNEAKDQDGHRYHSRFEAKVGRDLDLRLKAGELTEIKRQVRLPLYGFNGGHVCDYIIDFVVKHKDGTEEYIEAKGLVMPIWSLKWKLLEDQMRGTDGVLLTVIRP